MKIINLRVGPVHTNCYIVYDENSKEAILVDPGENAGGILQNIEENNLKLKYILLTHSHFDHVIAVTPVKEATGAEIVIHKKDIPNISAEYINKHYGRYIKGEYKEPQIDIKAVDGTEVTFGNLTATYIHTPGHTVGSSVIKIDKALFTGDTLFAGECGRCDLDGGDFNQMLKSLKKIAEIEGNFDVYPGHEQFSTLDEERKSNRYIRQAMSV